jgi:hypothetical protein
MPFRLKNAFDALIAADKAKTLLIKGSAWLALDFAR